MNKMIQGAEIRSQNHNRQEVSKVIDANQIEFFDIKVEDTATENDESHRLTEEAVASVYLIKCFL